MKPQFVLGSPVLLAALVLAALPGAAQDAGQEASADEAIEQVLVTAQRVEESVQDVPIAVTALTDSMLQDRQVINTSDLQLNAPNVSFSATNFGGSSFSIRGIGNLVIGRTGESGVSFHVNEIAMPTNLNAIEFFDMERVEILRGPQGTLFGRNDTGGAVNFVTKMPDADSVNGFVDAQAGTHAHKRLKGAVNLPFGNRVALRIAGFQLDRDGYTENLAFGQTDGNGNTLPGIDDDVDGRDILAWRTTLSWQVTEDINAWVMYSRFEEDDDRARITNQVCVRNPLPTTCCLPDEFGWQQPHLGAIFAGAAGALRPGVDGSSSSLYDFPRPDLDGFRQMHTDFEPVFQNDEATVAFGLEAELGDFTASVIGASAKLDYLSQQDYQMDVGASLAATPFNPTGTWPVSRPAGGAGAEWQSETCNMADGTSGLLGGCVQPTQMNRVFAFDQLDSAIEFDTVEAKVRSNFDGQFNFLIGASQYEGRNYGGYYVLANTLDLVTSYGSPALGAPPLYPGFFYNTNDPDAGGSVQDGTAIFGELYFDVSEKLTLTAGLRYNEDNKETSDTSVLFNSADANTALGGLLGPNPI